MKFPTMWYVRPAKAQSACEYAQSVQSLCYSFEYNMTVKLLTEHHLEFIRLTEGCAVSPESIHVKMPNCLKSHVMAQLISRNIL